uniref:Integrase catalytic domain-containing protein n=1 Tax=Trichuris muris TaxID=70415 RepID=A0A5S6QFK2_TRIMR
MWLLLSRTLERINSFSPSWTATPGTPEPIPFEDATPTECARALLSWISRFGICLRLTSDRGRQFISDIWREFCQLLGIQSRTTLAYEPHQNGLVERMHRDMKASLMATLQGDPNWVDMLPVILMDIRAAFKLDIGTLAAELILGETLRLPGQYFDMCPMNPTARSQRVCAMLSPGYAQQRQHGTSQSRVVPCSSHRRCHQPPMSSSESTPTEPRSKHLTKVVTVLSRDPKSYLLELEAGIDSMSIDRLKPAFLIPCLLLTLSSLRYNKDFSPARIRHSIATTP